MCRRKQCSLFRWVGSCADEGQLKRVISRERSVCFINELKATEEVGRRDKKKVKTSVNFFPARSAQPSNSHTFSLSPKFNSNYKNWTIYYLAVMGKCAQCSNWKNLVVAIFEQNGKIWRREKKNIMYFFFFQLDVFFQAWCYDAARLLAKPTLD